MKKVGRPRDDNDALRVAISRIVPSDGWMRQGEIARRLPASVLPHTPTGRQRLRTTLLRVRDENHDLLRRESIPGKGRGPFWRRAVGSLKFEEVHHGLFERIRDEVYMQETPDITMGQHGELYVYGPVDPAGLEVTVGAMLDLLGAAGTRAAKAQRRAQEALELLRDANRKEAEVRRVQGNHGVPPPPQRFAILIVPFVSKVGRGETFWGGPRVRTEDGRIVRPFRRIRPPGRKRR